jgi:hypothetical protein
LSKLLNATDFSAMVSTCLSLTSAFIWPDYRVKQHAKFLPEPFVWLGSTLLPVLESAHAHAKFYG